MNATKIAGTLSVLLHPLFIPVVFVLLIFRLNIYPFTFFNNNLIFFVLALVVVFNILTPLIIMYLMKRMNVITTLFLNQRRERIFPLFIYAILLYMTAMISKKWGLPALWEIVILLSAMMTLLSILVAFFWQISLHMVSWGALTGLVVSLTRHFQADYLICLTLVILLSGVVAWSRAELKAHKAGELMTGFAMGFLLMSAGLYVLIYINTA